jgi:Leucine-rich repeat (LRR) protein
MRFPHLTSLDCSRNRIQHLEGTHQARNLTQLLLPANQLPMTREVLNQLLVLTQLQELDMEDNPQEMAAFPPQQIELMLVAKLPQLAVLNQQQVGL